MPLKKLPVGYLKHLRGEAEDMLEEAFAADEVPRGLALRTALKDAVNTYCNLFDRAAPLVAEVVEKLPYQGDFEEMDALLGVRILEETRAALNELLENDAEFREAMIGDRPTDDATDRAIRDNSYEFDDYYQLREKQRIDAEQRRRDAQHDADVRASFHNGKEDVDDQVGHSARETLDGYGQLGVFTFDEAPDEEQPKSDARQTPPQSDAKAPAPSDFVPASNAKAEHNPPVNNPPHEENKTQNAALRLFGERPKFIRINIPDFKGRNPIVVFRQATEWMVEQVIAVAAGSHRSDSFPRIAPIIDLPDEPLATSLPALRRLVADIRFKVKRLRPPMDEGGEQLRALLEQFEDLDPNNTQGLHGLLGEMLDIQGGLGEGEKDEPWSQPWNDDEGGGGGWNDS